MPNIKPRILLLILLLAGLSLIGFTTPRVWARKTSAALTSHWFVNTAAPKLAAVAKPASFGGTTTLTINPAVNNAGAVAELIAAIVTANANQDVDTIQFYPCSTYTFSAINNYEYGPNALPQISSPIIIEGNGSTLFRNFDSPGVPNFRFFYVAGGLSYNSGMSTGLPAGTLTLRNLTLRGGQAKGGDSDKGGGGLGAGGAIFSQGTLTLEAVTFVDNTARGGDANSGNGSTGGAGMGANTAANSADGTGFGGTFTGVGGLGASGGGGFRPGDDASGQNGGGQGELGSGGHDGGRGGSPTGMGGNYGFGGTGSNGGGGGIGGGGSGNTTGVGGGGGFGGGAGASSSGNSAGVGGFGGGGGVGTASGSTYGGGQGTGTYGGGGAGMGGAIFNHRGTVTLTNCTLYQNLAQGGTGASGLGGGIFNLNGTVNLYDCTIAKNKVGEGGCDSGLCESDAEGGAIYNLTFGATIEDGTAAKASVKLRNTILANSVDGNDNPVNDLIYEQLSGDLTVDYAGKNIVMGEGDIGSGVVPIGPLYSTADPQLGAPVTPNCHPNVLPITNTSPAYNTGTNGDIPPGITTDERGSARISAGTVDIGAYELFVNNDPAIIAAVGDPIVCNGPGGFVTVTATVTNPNNTQQPASFTANLDAGLTAMPGTCNASVNPSSCVIVAGGGSVTWAGNLNAGATVTLTYQAQVAANTLIGASLCAKSVANVGGAMKDVTACVSVNCPPSGFVPRTNVPASSQRAGSLLAFPYYTSKVAEQKDTRLTVSNIGERRAWVHLFFVDGTSCQQADQFLCLTPNASFSFKTSEYDPEATGFALAVAVDAQGNPVQNNVLIGNAFVRDGAYVDNYSAETFWRYDNGPNIGGRGFAVLALNGTQYDAAPIQFTAEIQSPQDTTGQKIVLAPLSGDLSGIANLSSALPTLSTAAAQVGSGIAANEEEKAVSFNALLSGGCLKSAVLSATFPRVPSGLGLLIPSGKAGSLTFRVGAGVGLLMTPRTGNNKWSGIRALHKNAIGNAALAIPVLVPVC